MSSCNSKIKIVKLAIQIIKHALQFYIKRPDANEKDLEKEKKLLKKVENEVNNFKNSNNIK